MVNSGDRRLLHAEAAARNALYKNNRDGTFTDVTDKAGVAGGKSSGWAWPSATTTTTATPTCWSPPTASASCTTTTATGRSPTSPRRRALAAPAWTTSAVWFDYDNDGRLDLFLCSFVRVLAREERVLRRQQAGPAFLLHPPRLQADAEPPLPQQRRRHLHRGQRKGTDIEAAMGKGLGVVATDINNDGLHGPVRRQRHRPELPLHEPRQGQVGGDRPGRRGRVQRQRHAALRHGRRCRRHRRRRQPGPLRGQRRPGDVLALPEQRRRVLLATWRTSTASPRPRGC